MALLAERRIEVRAYDKDLRLVGVPKARSSDAQSCSFTVAYNGIGTGNITVPVDHAMVPVLLQPGTRLQFRWLHDVDFPSASLQISGPVVATQAGLSARGAVITFTSLSDDVLLSNLAWPTPASDVTSQTSEYDTYTGGVDAACFDMVRANLLYRMGLPVTMVPMFFDGPHVTIKGRFHPLAEVVYPALEAGHRGLRMYQWSPGDPKPFFLSGAGQLEQPTILVEVYKPEDKPWVRWTPVLGIASGTASTAGPRTTRVVLGADGEGTARTFRRYDAPDLESEWGALWTREEFVDARDADDDTERAARGATALAAGLPTGALTVTAIDGEPWIAGVDYEPGTRVRIAAVTGEVIASEVVRAITFTSTPEDGTRVIPQIGRPSATADPDSALARALRGVQARLSALESRR